MNPSNISFNSKQPFLKGSDLYIITPEHHQITPIFIIKKISKCMYQYLNMHIRATIFHTTLKINSFIAFLFQQIDIAATYTHTQQHAQEQPQGTPHLPSLFTSGYTDMAFGHQAPIWLKVGKLHYSSLLHPRCGTWLSSRSHCRASVSLRGAGSGCGPAHRSGSCHVQ